MRESSIPRCYDRAGYSPQAVGWIIKNHAQLAAGSKPERAASLATSRPPFGPRMPAGLQEIADLEEALKFLRVLKPKLAEAVDTFIECDSNMTQAARRLGVNPKTYWSRLGRAYELIAEFI